MSSAAVATVVGNGELVLSAVIASAFVVLYAATAAWWRGEAGRNVMAFMAVIALVLDLSAVRVLAQPLPTACTPPTLDWFAWLRLAVFSFVPIVLAWRLWMLIRVQVLGASEDRQREKHDV